jgi:hypothetical protein
MMMNDTEAHGLAIAPVTAQLTGEDEATRLRAEVDDRFGSDACKVMEFLSSLTATVLKHAVGEPYRPLGGPRPAHFIFYKSWRRLPRRP